MYFAIFAEDAENTTDKRRQSRAAHLQRLYVLSQQGRLLVAGPHPIGEDAHGPRYSGSLIIAEFDSLEEAQRWAESDPYITAGIFKSVSVKPFEKVLP